MSSFVTTIDLKTPDLIEVRWGPGWPTTFTYAEAMAKNSTVFYPQTATIMEQNGMADTFLSPHQAKLVVVKDTSVTRNLIRQSSLYDISPLALAREQCRLCNKPGSRSSETSKVPGFRARPAYAKLVTDADHPTGAWITMKGIDSDEEGTAHRRESVPVCGLASNLKLADYY